MDRSDESRPLRIGLVIDIFEPGRGGGESYLINLARKLLDRGHEVHVFADRWEEWEGIRYHRVPSRRPGKTWPMIAFALKAPKIIAQHPELDVVHVVGKALGMNLMNSHGGVEARWLVQNFRSIRSPLYRFWKKLSRLLNPRHYFIPWLERKQYTDLSVIRVIAISGMLRRHIQETYGVPDSKIRTVYNGVDVDRFKPSLRETHRNALRDELGVDPDAPVILNVSNNFRLKGLASLLEALAMLRSSEIGKHARLWIVGRGRERPYRRLASRLGIADAVTFFGQQKGIEKYYGAADVYAHPTFYDACSLVVLEAMACGLPVITTATNGASGYIEHGVNGYILEDPADSTTLAELMKTCLDSQTAEKIGRAARTRAEEFPLERNTEEVLAVYREVVAER